MSSDTRAKTSCPRCEPTNPSTQSVMPSSHLVATSLLVTALLAAACSRQPSVATVEDFETTAGCPRERNFRGGSLVGRVAEVRTFSGAQGGLLKKRRNRDAPHRPGPNPLYTIKPACKNHDFTVGELVDGRFIGIIEVKGDTAHRFSRTDDDDVVAWWVFGTVDPVGSIRLQSEFVSLSAAATDEAIISAPFKWCTKEEDWNEESGGWHLGDCSLHPISVMDVPEGGDNPWFGCKLGCCYSAMDEA